MNDCIVKLQRLWLFFVSFLTNTFMYPRSAPSLCSDSFINDSSQLGYTQDDLDRVNADSHTDECDLGETYHYRQINHQKDMSDFWKTPVFNRRMLKAATSESQDSEPSQKGLGNMNFIRSVLDHHRA